MMFVSADYSAYFTFEPRQHMLHQRHRPVCACDAANRKCLHPSRPRSPICR